jgi:putative ABC transport system permease protein
MDTLIKNIWFSLRLIQKNPGSNLVVILSLALAIGANTAIFSVINAVVLSPLPYLDPDRLVMVYTVDPGAADVSDSAPWPYPMYQELARAQNIFEHVAAISEIDSNLSDTEQPERVQVELVSASYFPILSVKPVEGRAFLPEEDATPTSHPVVLISYELWRRKYGASQKIVGRNIHLDRVPLTIIGVLPEGFRGQSGGVDVWAPMMMAPPLTFPERLTNPNSAWHDVIARLKPGVSLAQAEAGMEVIAKQIATIYPAPPGAPELKIHVSALGEAKLDPALRKSFLILFAAVVFVLFIACTNIANLLLARGMSRQREIAIRLALGAERRQLVSQLLTESVILALIGGVVGLLIAFGGIKLLTSFELASIANRPGFWSKYIKLLNFSTIRIDAMVLLFNTVISVITGLLFGLIPAIQASRPDIYPSLKEGSRFLNAKGHNLRRASARSLLVISEVALALVLLIGAGLMIESFKRMGAIELGFRPDHVLTMKINLPEREYTRDKAFNFFRQIENRVAALPGVKSVSVSSSTPLSRSSGMTIMKIEGQPPPRDFAASLTSYHTVGPNYFDALRIPLLKGRGFTERDQAGVMRVAIINEAAAKKFFEGQDPIGKRLFLELGWKPEGDMAEIVGVVKDVKYGNVDEAVGGDVYLCYLQHSEVLSLIARTVNDPYSLVAPIRNEVLSLDPNLPIFDVKTMDERVADSTARTRFIGMLLGIFSAIALTLSAMGVYGVIVHSVAERTHEIGVRMALGARQSNIFRLVVGDGLILTVIGIIVGVAAAIAVNRILSSFLYAVSSTEPKIFIIVAMLLTVVTLFTSLIPARRAAKVDPVIAIRNE